MLTSTTAEDESNGVYELVCRDVKAGICPVAGIASPQMVRIPMAFTGSVRKVVVDNERSP